MLIMSGKITRCPIIWFTQHQAEKLWGNLNAAEESARDFGAERKAASKTRFIRILQCAEATEHQTNGTFTAEGGSTCMTRRVG